MRLLELRLIEDQHSFVRFPGNLTIVAGMSPAARNWFVHAAPLLLEGIACGASAFVEFGGATHEIGAGALAQRFLDRPVAVVLDAAPFQRVIADHLSLTGRPYDMPVVVAAEHIAQAEAAHQGTIESVGVLERSVRLEAALCELDSALHSLIRVDTREVDSALEVVRVITATGAIEVPEAIRLADEYRAVRSRIAALEERVAVGEGGMVSVKGRLDQARARFAAAEAKLLPATTNAEDIVALERAHDSALEAERRVSGLFGSRWRKQLDDALAVEQVVLDRLGYPTWSAFIMGARMLDSTAENKRQLEHARRELEDIERVRARVMAKLGDNVEFCAYFDRLERLQEAAHAIVGDVDDVEAALRALRVDPGPRSMTVEQARDNLASSLLAVGFGIETHVTLEDLQGTALTWLDEVHQISWLHSQLEADAKHCAQELDEARETLERIQLVGAVDEIDGFGADRLYTAREDVARAEECMWRHRDALIRVAQLVAESERVMELAYTAATDDERDEAGEAGPMPSRVEALTAVLEERINELREAGTEGSIPLVLDDAFAGLPSTERAELLGWLEGYSLFLQVIYLTDGPEVVAWAEGRTTPRIRVVRGEGFFG
ncbi:unannotated protein [freshwater metagenome]|uniref:Unannotated protein n=1 Tax=freshwater metagenome TaxID=449393 RepID=A0A6J6TTH5_9ZZZZ|nr:hypothetical protein [Actinomycetota bacterium]